MDKSTGLRSDQTVRLSDPKTRKDYPHTIRRISYRDPETGKLLILLTSNFEFDALTIAKCYKARWQWALRPVLAALQSNASG